MRHFSPAVLLLLLAGVPDEGTVTLPAAVDLTPDPLFVVADSVQAQLTFVSDLALDPDGSLYLADAMFPAVLHLEPDGSLRRILGRGGSGPGEFSRLFQLGVIRDSLWVVDPGLLRVTLFPRRGRGQATVPFGRGLVIPPGDHRPYARYGVPAALLPDGGMLVEEVETVDGAAGSPPARLIVLRTERQSAIRDTLTRLPWGNSSMRFVNREGAAHKRQPFTDDPTIAIASDGSLVVQVDRAAARSEAPSSFTVRAWRDGREPLWTREVRYRPARLTRAIVDSVAEAQAGPPPITADSIRARLYRPAMLPPVDLVVVGQDRSIWLRVRFADSPAGRADWMLLSPNGYPLRRVTTDARFRPCEVERGALWGVIHERDELPRIVRYRVPAGS
jgi:hypothetical protein